MRITNIIAKYFFVIMFFPFTWVCTLDWPHTFNWETNVVLNGREIVVEKGIMVGDWQVLRIVLLRAHFYFQGVARFDRQGLQIISLFLLYLVDEEDWTKVRIIFQDRELILWLLKFLLKWFRNIRRVQKMIIVKSSNFMLFNIFELSEVD